MRRLNAFLGAALYVVIIIHVVLGCYMLLTGGYVPVLKFFARIAVVLIAVHLLLGIIFFARSCRDGSVFKHPALNKRFWAQRISALVVLVIMFWHGHSFGGVTANGYELFAWDPARLGLSLLFVACLGVHLTTSAPALALSLGIPSGKRPLRVVQLLLLALALVAALAFCMYAKVMWA
ncbi:MAG: hypothetical protein ACI36W_06505 [Coriobacteriales bacterium]